MKKNMGTIDRVIRVGIAVVIGALYFAGIIQSTTALVLGGLAIIMAATSFLGFCPLYLPFGLSTCKKTPGHEA